MSDMESSVFGGKRIRDSKAVVTLLKACSKKKDLKQGSKLHADICSNGLLENNTYLGNSLVSMYAKCGAFSRAQQVFEELPVRDVVSWNVLIAGYAQQGQGAEALACFRRMQSEGLSPEAITYASTLKACGIMREADLGKKIHDDIISQGLLDDDIVLGTALVDMYAKCGAPKKAQDVLEKLSVRNVVSWNALIAGYAQQGQGEEALDCFLRMRSEGFFPDAFTYVCILKVCGIMRKAGIGENIHDEILSHGMLKGNVVLGTALVDMYAHCGVFSKAREVFDALSFRNVVSWSALIARFAEHGLAEEALQCFEQMQGEGFSPDQVTYASILKACGIMREADTGKRIHEEMVSRRMLEGSVVLGTALVNMYAKCGLLTKAREVFDELSVWNVVSWSALIAGYAQQGQAEDALSCFHRMKSEDGLSPDAVTYAYVLKACGIVQDVDTSKQVHDEIASQGLLGKHTMLSTSLVDMYAKCGLLMEAQRVLEMVPFRNIASWNALIAGCTHQGQVDEALKLFEWMLIEGLSPNAVSYVGILKACGIIQEADVGGEIHDEIAGQGMLDRNVVVGTALVDMYGKCGLLTTAQSVFHELPVRNTVSWNALISGYAQHGQGKEALDCFKRMQLEGLTPDVVSWNALIAGYAQQGLAQEALVSFQCMQREGTSPDGITFINMLRACSHSGLVEEGQMYFEGMKETYGLVPDKEHFTCMVDLLGRARHFDQAMRVIKMAFSDYLSIWSALLGACRKWGNVKLGRFAFEHTVQLDRCNAAAYVSMADIYAAAGMQGNATKAMKV